MAQELIKTVNGIQITRTVGTKFPYFISLREGNGYKEFHSFKTRKEAIAFAESITK